VTAAVHDGPLWIGPHTGAAALVAEALGCACRVDAPEAASEPADRDGWARRVERWRNAVHPARHSQVVVATFAEAAGCRLTAITPEQWRQRLEMPFTLGFAALQLAAASCADGGAIVLVLRVPERLDAAGHAPAIAVAEGLQTAARSVALAEAHRGVRVNTVMTAADLASAGGGREVAGAVRALLGSDAAGITGQVVRARGGAVS
jgi:hypothetical protein